ncbi:MAG: hypothetical protein N3F03_02500 [Ignavibacteria bacterium]|nr:hypothetical protein [Ignavibacteria bacterium]
MLEKKSTNFFFKTMNLIYLGYLISGCIVILFSIYLWNFDLSISTSLSTEKKIVIGIYSVISVILSQLTFKKTISKIKLEDQLIVKLQSYQSAVIYKLSILEFTLIVTIMFFIFTKVWSLLIISVIFFALILISRPNKKNLLKNLPFSSNEVELLYQK